MNLDIWESFSFKSINEVICFYFVGIYVDNISKFPNIKYNTNNLYTENIITNELIYNNMDAYIIGRKVIIKRICMSKKMKRSKVGVSFIVSIGKSILHIYNKGIII